MIRKFKVLLGVLSFFLFLPVCNAELPESMYVKFDGYTSPLYAKYQWYEKSDSGYLTEDEQKGKRNLDCDSNDVEYWWYSFFTKCGLDSTKIPHISHLITSCTNMSYGALANTKINSEKECREMALGGSYTCTLVNGTKRTVTVTKDNIYYNTTSGLDTVGEKGGVWSKSNPAPGENNYSRSNVKRENCSWGGEYVTSSKRLLQSMYSTDTGATAYCIHPGKQFVNQTYNLMGTFDVSECKTSNESFHCGLAATILAAEKSGITDYLTINTALRLWTAAKNQGDGWWDSQTNITYSRSSIYKFTQEAIDSEGYAGSTSVSDKGLIYATNDTLGQLQSAISLYKQVRDGFEIWAPQVELDEESKKFEEGMFSFALKTNFDENTEIISVSATNGLDLSNYTLEPCENDAGMTCLVFSVPIDTSRISVDCITSTITIKFNHPDAVITKVGLYQAASGTSQKYQDMFIFDRGVESSIDVELEICPPVCEFRDGNWYGREGQILSGGYTEYLEECGCIEEVDPETGETKYYVNYPIEVPYEVYYEECERIDCPDPGIEENVPDDCEDGTNDVVHDGITYEGTMEDPPMCNILNREDANYYKSEYSNEYCNVYCRETLMFDFMDKESAKAGQFFQHHVYSKYSDLGYLSLVILSTRQCTSIIEYESWKVAYESANERVRTTWNHLKRWESFYNLAGGNPTSTEAGGGCSGCDCSEPDHPTYYAYWQYSDWTETQYDGNLYTHYSDSTSDTGGAATCSYSCCCWVSDSCDEPPCGGSCTCGPCCGSCSPATSADLNMVRNTYNQAVASYKSALDNRDRLLYLLSDCNYMDDSTTSRIQHDGSVISDKTLKVFYTKAMYTGGSYYIASAAGNYVTPAQLETYNEVMSYEPENTVEIDYEENYTYDEGFPISIANEYTEPEVVQMNFYEDKEDYNDRWEDYCGEDCEGDLSTLSSSTYTEKVDYWSCTGSETGAVCRKMELTVPKNFVTNIEIEIESLHYQEAQLYTEVYTGDVSDAPSSNTYWIPMEEHVYPVGITRVTGDYDIEIYYSNLGDQNRVVKFESGDALCAYRVINDLAAFDCDDGYHICYPCDDGTQNCYDEEEDTPGYNIGVYFRSIDLTDVFPNSYYSPYNTNNLYTTRSIGYNWKINNAYRIVREIQDLGNDIWTYAEPQYVITLTPSMINGVKDYNKTTNYQDNSLNCGSDLYCTSYFLSDDLKDIIEDNMLTNRSVEDYYIKDTTVSLSDLYFYRR